MKLSKDEVKIGTYVTIKSTTCNEWFTGKIAFKALSFFEVQYVDGGREWACGFNYGEELSLTGSYTLHSLIPSQ